MSSTQLIDTYNRNLNYLRVSVTDRCNLRCMYCVPPHARINWLSHKEILRYEEILRVIRVGVNLGISKIRVTGGEPLVRKGIYDFLYKLGKIDKISDISLTTNGVLLKDNIKRLKDAGIKRLNISLDSLNPQKFKKITGHDTFNQVWEGILAAHEAGFFPIKINTVAMNGVNNNELKNLAGLSLKYPFHMRFIEYMPIGDEHLDAGKQMLAPEIMDCIRELGELIPVINKKNDGPAERCKFKNAKGEVGFIRPLSHHFCSKCNRLRLTASGQLRPCLLSDRQIDVKTPLREGCLDEEIIRVFIEAGRFKPMQHHLCESHPEDVKAAMSSIGG